MVKNEFSQVIVLAMSFSAAVTTSAWSQTLYERCSIAAVDGDAAEVERIVETIERLSTFSASTLGRAKACLESHYKYEVVYDYGSSKFSEGATLDVKKQDEVMNQHRQWVADFVANQEAEQVQAREALALEKLKSQLNAKIPLLEKRASCVNAKLSQMNTDLEAINKRFEQSNQALILDETHEACVELYSSDKPAAMINSTCVEAFQRKGHPSLVFSESEQLANLSAELLELIELEEGVGEELISAKIQLLEAEGVVTKEELNQKVADDMEAKSCAEFGYDGVYLD